MRGNSTKAGMQTGKSISCCYRSKTKTTPQQNDFTQTFTNFLDFGY